MAKRIPSRSNAFLTTVALSLSLILGGCLTDDGEDDGGGNGQTALESRTAVLGAHQNATLGSSINLDSMEVFTYADAPANAAKIDLFYALSETENSEAFYAPQVAKTGIGGSAGFGAGIGGPADWTVANNTPMRRVTVGNLDDIDTQAELDSLWADGVPVAEGRLLVAEDLDFMVQTDEDMLVLIRVLEIQAGAAGSAGIRVKAVFPKL
jgi:hypothetical protein